MGAEGKILLSALVAVTLAMSTVALAPVAALRVPEMFPVAMAWPATAKSKRALPTCQRAAIGTKHELFTCIPPSGMDGAGAPSAAARWPDEALLACGRI